MDPQSPTTPPQPTPPVAKPTPPTPQVSAPSPVAPQPTATPVAPATPKPQAPTPPTPAKPVAPQPPIQAAKPTPPPAPVTPPPAPIPAPQAKPLPSSSAVSAAPGTPSPQKPLTAPPVSSQPTPAKVQTPATTAPTPLTKSPTPAKVTTPTAVVPPTPPVVKPTPPTPQVAAPSPVAPPPPATQAAPATPKPQAPTPPPMTQTKPAPTPTAAMASAPIPAPPLQSATSATKPAQPTTSATVYAAPTSQPPIQAAKPTPPPAPVTPPAAPIPAPQAKPTTPVAPPLTPTPTPGSTPSPVSQPPRPPAPAPTGLTPPATPPPLPRPGIPGGQSVVAAPTTPPPAPAAPPPPTPKKSGLFKKLLPILLLVLVLVGVGVGVWWWISQSAAPTPPPLTRGQTLEYWGLWEPESVMRPVLDQFTAETGIEVVYKQNTVKEYRQRLITDVSVGGGPDVFRFHNTWTPTLIEGLAPIPRSSVTTIGLETDFYPVVTKDVRRGTEFYGVPLMMDGLALYYNKAMFQTAGKTPPVTWNELRETAIDLTIRNNQRIERGGIALGTTNNVDHFSDILGLMILQNGGNPADPESSLVQTAVAFYSLFSNTDKVWDGTFPTSTYAFATEKVAMMIAPSWRAHEISQINPNLDFATTQLPQLPLEPGQSPVTWASYWVDGVNANSNAQSAAFTLLEYLSRPAVLQNIYARAASERLFGPVYPRVSMASLVQNDPYVGAYVAQAPYALSWPMASSTMDQGLNDRIIKYYEDFLNAGVSQQSATQAKQGVAQILSQFGVSASR